MAQATSPSMSKTNLKKHPYTKYNFNREELLEHVKKSVAEKDSNYVQEVALFKQRVENSIRREEKGKIVEGELETSLRIIPESKAFKDDPLSVYFAYWLHDHMGEKSCLRILNPWKSKKSSSEQKLEAYKMWQLIWKLNISLIVQLPPRSSAYPGNVEDKVNGVYQLLPDSNEKEQKYITWVVKWKSDEKFDGFLLSTIDLINGDQKREVQVLRLLNWPDVKSDKPDTKQFVNFMKFFRQKVSSLQNKTQQIAVYCNSRQCTAGLFFMYKTAIEQFDDDNFDKLSMPEIMGNMIGQSIATSELDYKFCYFALRDYILDNGGVEGKVSK